MPGSAPMPGSVPTPGSVPMPGWLRPNAWLGQGNFSWTPQDKNDRKKGRISEMKVAKIASRN
ncbi:hypothetical protein Vi05172_g10502 [Venturia inaequalis]|nr:hypothetical protein Vi05172_g10502 [Venturia inaequalis]